MKKTIVIIAGGLLVGGGLWLAILFRRSSPEGAAIGPGAPPVFASDRLSKASDQSSAPSYPDADELQQISARGEFLYGALARMAEASDVDGIDLTLREVLYAFKGDPAAVFSRCRFLLEHSNPAIRCLAAEAFLTADVNTEVAQKVLLSVLSNKDKQNYIVHRQEIDFRIYSANSLTKRKVEAASDPIWDLYSITSDSHLLIDLARLGDGRSLRALEAKGVTPARAITFCEVFGRLRDRPGADVIQSVIAVRNHDGLPVDQDRFRAEMALYQITGDEGHLDYLIQNANSNACLNELLKVKSPKVEALFKRLVSSDDLGAETAFLGLQRIDPGSSEVRHVITSLLEGNPSSRQISTDVVVQVAVRMDDAEVQRLGERWDDRNRLGTWLRWKYRKNWPVFDDRLQYL